MPSVPSEPSAPPTASAQISVHHTSTAAVKVLVTDLQTGQLVVQPPYVLGPGQSIIGGIRAGAAVTLVVAGLDEMTVPLVPVDDTTADDKPRLQLVT